MSTTTVHFVDRSTTVRFPVATITSTVFLALLDSYFDNLAFYDSNEEAVIGGLSVGARYKAGDGHVAAPYGAILTVTT